MSLLQVNCLRFQSQTGRSQNPLPLPGRPTQPDQSCLQEELQRSPEETVRTLFNLQSKTVS